MTTNLVDYSRNLFSCSSGGWEFAVGIPGQIKVSAGLHCLSRLQRIHFLCLPASGGCWLLAFLDPWPLDSGLWLCSHIASSYFVYGGSPGGASGEDVTCQCRRQREREMRHWSLGWEDPLVKGLATHSSILARRIPWTEEPGGLQSTGSQRVWSDLACSHSVFGPSFCLSLVCFCLYFLGCATWHVGC